MSQQDTLNTENPADFEGTRLQLLQQILDSHTQRRFERIGIQPGWHCLEIGAGEGSIARWLAQKIGPQGTVVATDIDTRGLAKQQQPNLEIRRHDILADDLEQSRYDVVHTRAVLMHLSNPAQAVQKMAAAVRPAGWLLLEEFDALSFGAIDTDNPTAQAFNQKMETILQTLKTFHIMDIYFGRHLRRLLEQLGFIDISNEGITGISRGGDPDTQFQLMTLQLSGPPLVGAGILTQQDVDLLRQLFADPSFYYVGNTFFGAWGKRPL